MNILIDLLRRIHQEKKKEILLVSINRLFFFSLLEYLNDLIYLYDLDHWCFFVDFIRRSLVLNRFYFDSNLDSTCEKRWRESFYSTFVNNLINNHLWRTLNADLSTRLSLWSRFYYIFHKNKIEFFWKWWFYTWKIWNQKKIKKICTTSLDDSTQERKNFKMIYNLNINFLI
jgi:hypothetical protein